SDDSARPLFTATLRPPPPSTLFPYTTLFRSHAADVGRDHHHLADVEALLDVAHHHRRRIEVVGRYIEEALDLPGMEVERHNPVRSEEHTSELQSLRHLVCRLLLEKKKTEQHV